MALRRPFLIVVVCTLAFVPTGCNAPAASSEAAFTPTPAASPTATRAKTACTNPLYPVVEGAEWSYSVSGISSTAFTRSIISVRRDGFTDQDVFDSGETRTGEWKCGDGALSALSRGESLIAMIQMEGTASSYKTTSATGITLPAIVTPGASWTQEFTVEGTKTISGQDLPGKGDVTYSCIGGDTETVAVPAGAFDAVRIGCQINGTTSVGMLGSDVPTELASVATIWYACGIGMIRTENEISGVGHTSILLTSYTIP
jgi:hypothetical protein